MNTFQQFRNTIYPGKVIYDPLAIFMSDGLKKNSNAKEKKIISTSGLLKSGPLRILLADDDVDDREMFAEALREIEFKVKLECAEDGRDLLQILHNTEKLLPHLIFLDLNMPNKTGIECLDVIRKDDRLKNIPVIIYSTSSSPKDIDETYEKGANLYVRKCSSFTDLTMVAKKVLSLNWDKYKPNTSRNNFLFSSKTI